MSSSKDIKRSIEAHKRWLGYLQPDGLVVSAAALVDKGHYYNEAQRGRQLEFIDHLETFQHYDEEEGTVEITDFKTLATDFLGLPAQEWIDAADLGDEYHVQLKESRETLTPTAALKWPRGKTLTDDQSPYQLLIWEPPTEIDGKDIDFDTPYEVIENTWSTSATRRFERMLRETNVPIGLLISQTHLRLVYAPVGENAGSLTFHFADMLSTMGRPILGAFDLLFNIEMLFIGEESHQLPALLKHSRDMQANVSIELAHQVLDGLYDLVRGTQTANARTDGKLLRQLLATNPNLIYEGQLNVLMRLVFLLFAEDRGLMPNSELYNQHYSVHALYERLRQDHALHHDTMDERYGAWAQLLALFRLIFHGHRHKDLNLPPRYGYLFDPDRFPFLEGKCTNPETKETEDLNIPLIGDGTIFRLLQGLLFLNGERISYRTLDVEQIGSVYETMMGFALTRAEGQTIAIRPQKKHGAAANLNLDHVLDLPAKGTENRHKHFTAETGRKFTGKRLTEFNTAATTDELLAVFQGPTTNSNIIARNATPHLAQPGSLLLQPTDARRKSGSHYTPRKLTEPIVRKALEPVLANLGEKPSPSQILDLKVCDPAVGSGAFLVEACRQLGDELVKAWATHLARPHIPEDEDEILHARRLVAQRCLYGVDRNPMAADLAKLSLWLATLAKDHPFTFLAHAIRSGDSLVGLSKKQILAFHWDLNHKTAQQRVFGQDLLEKKIKSALAYRQEILNAGDLVLPEMKAQQLRLAEEEVDKVRRAGDLAVLGFFSGSKPKERQEARDQLLERWLKATDQSGSEESLRQGIALNNVIRRAIEAEKPVTPFHWEVEFPEVFERRNAGFDVFVGNPPFAGKNNVIRGNHNQYPDWLKTSHPDAHGNADLVVHFFRQSFDHLRNSGTLGLIATNTIAQGDTRSSGLAWICNNGGEIYSAHRRYSWPGAAAVIVSVVHIIKGKAKAIQKELDGACTSRITAYLFSRGGHDDPATLSANAEKSFQGSIILGMGFTFDDSDRKGIASRIDDMRALVQKSDINADRIFPFIGWQEVANSPQHLHHRYIIDFFDMSEAEARRWPDLMEIIEQKVKPDRETQKRDALRERWWQYAEKRPGLVRAIDGLSHVLVIGSQAVSQYAFARLPTGLVYSSNLNVLPFTTLSAFCMLSSGVHERWARAQGSTLKDDFAYTPTTCFETFPFPGNWEFDSPMEDAGSKYCDYRAELMVRNNEGLTKTYNRFHDRNEISPDIHHLRELHIAMDRAVLDAYGWTDVPTDCEFIPDFTEEDDDGNEIPKNIRYRWPDEVRDDVLARLLALNAERYQAEVNAGLHTKAAKKSAKKKTTRKRAAKKAAKKTAKPITIDVAADATDLPGIAPWEQHIDQLVPELPEGMRFSLDNSTSYYRFLLRALIEQAGGSISYQLLHSAIIQLNQKDDLANYWAKESSGLYQAWENSFKEDTQLDGFHLAEEQLYVTGKQARIVGTAPDFEVRLVEGAPSINEPWLTLDAQLLLKSALAAQRKDQATSISDEKTKQLETWSATA